MYPERDAVLLGVLLFGYEIPFTRFDRVKDRTHDDAGNVINDDVQREFGSTIFQLGVRAGVDRLNHSGLRFAFTRLMRIDASLLYRLLDAFRKQNPADRR